MVLILKTDNGCELHGPPYTKAEERDFYKRIGGGPVTVARGPVRTDKEQPTPEPPQPSPAKRRRS